MNHVKFIKSSWKAEIRSPLTGFKPQTQIIERRKDPLLNRWCRINIERANRPKDRVGDTLVQQLVESSRKNCPFCPDRLTMSTPMFPRDLIPEGRLRVGEAVVFPNLFAFAQHHAVVVLTKSHYVDLDCLKQETIRDGLSAAIMYLRVVSQRRLRVRYCSINWNSLPTAAASMIHPHLQVIADVAPTSYLFESLKASQSFQKRRKANFWDDLLEYEKRNGERFIAEYGNSSWLTSFCGLGNNEVLGIVDASNLFELSEETLEDLSRGLSQILRCYNTLGVQGFNLSLYSGPLNANTPYFKVHVRIISRPDPRPMYTSDTGFLERLHNEVVVETRPEDVAKRMREIISA